MIHPSAPPCAISIGRIGGFRSPPVWDAGFFARPRGPVRPDFAPIDAPERPLDLAQPPASA
jgi:hypothetical protein